jgi:hypothetical protein
MFYSDTQSSLNFLRILNRLEVGVFTRAVKLESPCKCYFSKNTILDYVSRYFNNFFLLH